MEFPPPASSSSTPTFHRSAAPAAATSTYKTLEERFVLTAFKSTPSTSSTESQDDNPQPSTLQETFTAIMNASPPVSQVVNSAPTPPSSESSDLSPLLQMLQEMATNGGASLQLTMDALNMNNARVELPSNPLKDISTIVGKRLSNEEIVEFLKDFWKPSSNFEFPLNDEHKRFRYAWLRTYPFCTFSYVHEGLYCVPCALRSVTRYPKNGRLTSLINEPLKKFTKFSKKMNGHIDTLYHRENMNYVTALCPDWMNPKVISLRNEPFQDEAEDSEFPQYF